MLKQKKFQNKLSSVPKIAQKPQKVYPWTQQNFSQLYPTPPNIITSSTFITVGLNYHGTLIKVKLPSNIPNKHLPYIFHKEIYIYLLNMHDKNPLLKTSKILGFQTVDGDILLDYQIALGQGILSRKISFNCLEYMEEGQSKLKRYKICKCLAIGGFSKVYLVRSLRDGQFYAMKVMLKKFINSTQKQSIIQNEKNICAQLNHPFIVKLNHAFQTHNFVCFVLDYCPGGELFYHLKRVKRMSEEEARFYFIQIMYGLLYLHQHKIVYRDLKPENLLINFDGHIKIADFGLSKANMNQRQLTYSFCGSTQYMPPQMILREGHSYGVDFYTLGALLYELVTGLPPFYSKDQEQIKDSIINQQLSFPDHIHLSSQIKNLLSGLLNKNQKLRIGSMKGLKQILFHPWVGRINSQVILGKKLQPPFIPNVDEFNFDESQLGDDQQEFTQMLISEHLIPKNKQKLIYNEFQFKNENLLSPQIEAIFSKYEPKIDIAVPKRQGIVGNSSRKQQLRKCNSLKNLKPSHTIEVSKGKTPLKRQASSPYLRTSSSTKTLKNNKKSFTNSQEKTIKNILKQNKNTYHNHNQRSLSKKKLKDASQYMNLLGNEKSLLNNSQSAFSAKKITHNSQFMKNCKQNNIKKPYIKSNKAQNNLSNPFLKKKTLVYSYLDKN